MLSFLQQDDRDPAVLQCRSPHLAVLWQSVSAGVSVLLLGLWRVPTRVTGIQTGNLAVVGDILCIVGMRVCVWESVCVTLEAKVSPLFVLSVKTRSLSALRPAKDVRVAE